MEDQRFEALTRGLAQSTSRRQALKVMLAAAAGGIFARSGVGVARAAVNPQQESACIKYCLLTFKGKAAQDCVKQALSGQGACFTCGPGGQVGHPDVCAAGTSQAFCCSASKPNCCSTTCVNFQTDSNNCGSCGNVCSTGDTCVNGKCVQGCGISGNCDVGFTNCAGNGNTNCFCFTAVDGSGVCGCNSYCSQVSSCNSSSDCPAGNACVTSTGCTGCNTTAPGVCIPFCQGGFATCTLGASSIHVSSHGVSRLTAISHA